MNEIAVVYSTLTGNTKLVAEAVAKALDTTAIFDVKEAPDVSAYNKICVGYWVDRGTADASTRDFMATLHEKEVFVFGTLGANPLSPHGEHSKVAAAGCVPADCQVVGSFICQGKIDPKIIEMFKKMPLTNSHAATEENQQLWADAESHPNEEDLQAAMIAARAAFHK
ncbi:flavodoxin family protein [Veillonella montpellierensis]|uniref:flavodoxin family protein n=1 Tax=Veillonella montpellierensis TaxID=187328 RepID=UPI0023F6F339|nr:flavodoxin family protein [Veillonella montpellierensis]